MPQGRRRVAFSGKKKKQQLTDKRLTKQSRNNFLIKKSTHASESDDDSPPIGDAVQKINFHPYKINKSDANRYVLQFKKETEKEMREMKEEARKPLQYKTPVESELGSSYFKDYDFPRRPDWTFEMSKEQLERKENINFTVFMQDLERFHFEENKRLSFCELNLETWRQLWRVLELSDIILIIVDIRFPALMFSPTLYHYITVTLGKNVILVLNKVDLAPAPVTLAWKKYFEQTYDSIKVVLFTSFPSYNLQGKQTNKKGLTIRRKRGRMRMAAEGALEIYKACQELINNKVNISSWEKKIRDELHFAKETCDTEEETNVIAEQTHEEVKEFDFEKHEKFKDGIATVGCIGFPNVGKSSLLNALMGKKVVSVSRTPGHTKHFQTIFLTNNVRLCDCPGLVFPSAVPRKLQVLMGSYPIAQLREPYAAIKYLAERLNVPEMLDLLHPEGGNVEWSAIDLCDAWALKRGFITAKAARPDTYRAANNILRMALDGKLVLNHFPQGYTKDEDKWAHHADLTDVEAILARGRLDDSISEEEKPDFSSDSELETRSDEQTSSNDSDGDSSAEDANPAPSVSNAFTLLNTSVD